MEEKDENESSGLTEEDMRALEEIGREIFGDVLDNEVKANDEYNPKVTYLKLQDKTVMCFDDIGFYAKYLITNCYRLYCGIELKHCHIIINSAVKNIIK